MPRPSRDEVFIEITLTVAKRSTCLRGQVGALIVVDKHIVSMGYNGAPPGQPQCDEVGCGGGEINPAFRLDGDPDIVRQDEPYLYPNGCTRSTHAEMNAVAFAARQGIPCDEGTLYSTHATCIQCARAVVAAGIVRVVYAKPYRLTEGIELLDQCNLEVVHYGQ